MNDLKLPPAPVSREGLLAFLDAAGFETRTVSHEPLFTVEQSQNLHGQMQGGHTKNLFLKDKKDNFFLVTVEATAAVDLKQLHKVVGGSSRLSFGKPDKLMEYLGVIPGAVTAFGVINDRGGAVKFILDAALARHHIINCHPLTNDATTGIKTVDLLAFVAMTGHEAHIMDLY
jgi:Ala-tRNA(Pro) deacylase